MDNDTLVTAAVNVDANMELAGQEYHDGNGTGKHAKDTNGHFNSYGSWRGGGIGSWVVCFHCEC